MRLQDEYFRRHNINALPIYHTKNSSLILDSTPKVIVNIKFEEIKRMPAVYTFEYLKPNHNAYIKEDENYFLKLNSWTDGPYQYDEYISFILKWIKNVGFNPVKPSEVRLAIWEIFLYCFDGWFSSQNLEDIIYPTINTTMSVVEREASLDKFLAQSDLHLKQVYDDHFKSFETNYADWLVKLIRPDEDL